MSDDVEKLVYHFDPRPPKPMGPVLEPGAVLPLTDRDGRQIGTVTIGELTEYETAEAEFMADLTISERGDDA